MHVGTVLQQCHTHTYGKLAGQRLLGQCGTGDLLTSLTDEQREGVLSGTYLTLKVVDLCLGREIGCLSTVYGIGTDTTQVELLLGDVPRLFRHLRHLLHNAELLV